MTHYTNNSSSIFSSIDNRVNHINNGLAGGGISSSGSSSGGDSLLSLAANGHTLGVGGGGISIGISGGATSGVGEIGGSGLAVAEHDYFFLSTTDNQGPSIVAMPDRRQTQHQEAYYLFFVGTVGIALNLLVIALIFWRRYLRRMTSAFLIHAGILNLAKATFCIPFGLNLLSGADETDANQPPGCVFQGSSFIVLITTSAVNMVAMICTEAYTFGEVNVGGNSHGTTCCILFGVLVVYITSVILHLGPTLIGGDIVYNPDIGSCAFRLGNVTGYVANVMWILIITFSLVGVGHFLNKFYKEIQLNRPNRVSMLVRHSITISDEAGRKPSACTVHEMTQEAMHRAKMFVITAVAFVLCWYPLFLLILIDMNFKVSPKVYQAFSFIAWTQSTVEPLILIFFDRNLNLLARFMYCDREQYTASQIAYLMSQTRGQQQQQQQQQQHHHHQQKCNHHDDDDEDDDDSFDMEDLGGRHGGGGGGASAAAGGAVGGGNGGAGGVDGKGSNFHNLSMEIEDAFHATGTLSSRGGDDSGTGMMASATTPVCRRCSPRVPAHGEHSPHHHGGQHPSNARALSHSATPSASSPREMSGGGGGGAGFNHFQPVGAGRSDTSLETTFNNYDPVRLKDTDNDIQC